jgi:predicted dehydrogenase
VVALLNFEFRHQPGRAALRSFIQDGAIGPVEHLQWTMFGSGFRRRRPRWLFDAELGGGWIGAWGSHAIDFLRWTLGEIVDAHAQPRVTVVDRTSREGHTVPSTADDGFTAWLRTENGATVAIDTTFVAAVDLPPRVIVLGSEGALEMESDTRIWRIDGGGRHEVFRYDPIDEDPHLAPMQHWAAVVRDAVQTGVVPAGAPTFADGVACARVMDTLRVGSG